MKKDMANKMNLEIVETLFIEQKNEMQFSDEHHFRDKRKYSLLRGKGGIIKANQWEHCNVKIPFDIETYHEGTKSYIVI